MRGVLLLVLVAGCTQTPEDRAAAACDAICSCNTTLPGQLAQCNEQCLTQFPTQSESCATCIYDHEASCTALETNCEALCFSQDEPKE